MDRLHFVAIGGTPKQKPRCVYCGTDGDAARAAFTKAAADESNDAVRWYHLAEQTKTATPARFAQPKES